jgi:hypothetical protein
MTVIVIEVVGEVAVYVLLRGIEKYYPYCFEPAW